jgi:hypothetical protein
VRSLDLNLAPRLIRHPVRAAADAQFPLLLADVAHRFDGIDERTTKKIILAAGLRP